MHELHLAQDVLKIILKEAEARGLEKIVCAKVKIGESRITDPPEFKELLAKISVGTKAESLRLELEIVKLRAFCNNCQNEFSSDTPRLDCPYCGSTDIVISAGQELLVVDLK